MASSSRERSKADENVEDSAMRVDSESSQREGGDLKVFGGPSGGSAEGDLEGGGVGTPMPR